MVQYQYDSWGKLLGITGSLASTIGKRNPFRYRGYYYDDETGMYYLQSRYYDPEIKRFICADDIDNVSDLQEMPIEKNLYIYCDNNPIARIDTNGRAWLGVAIAGIAGALSSVGKQIKDGKSLKELNLIDVASSAISCAVAVTGLGKAVQAVVSGVTSFASSISNGDNWVQAGATAVANFGIAWCMGSGSSIWR